MVATVVILYLYLLCNDCLNWLSSFICICYVMIVRVGGHLVFVFVVQELVASVVVHVRLPSPLQL